ncbi:hypothetical protein BOO86_21710 [Mycobacterium sp. CBMA 234]|nr:hypothetical protein [Mycolicibacterium sp. CBMA 234]
MFTADGETVTIERIADVADVAVATIYQHFSGKDELHSAAVNRALEQNERFMVTVYQSMADPVDKLIDAVGAYLEFYLQSPWLFAMVELKLGHPAPTDDPAAAMISERVGRMNSMLTGVVQDGIRSGVLRKSVPRDTARFLWGSMNGIIGLALRPDALRLTEDEVRSTLLVGVETILDGMVTDALRGSDGRLKPAIRRRLRNTISAAGQPTARQTAAQ